MLNTVNRLRKLNARGDTIVEVLIVLAILAFAFSLASATAQKGLSQSRSAQEHARGQGVLNSQMEQLRKAASNPDPTMPLPTTPGNFCMKGVVPSMNLADCGVDPEVGFSFSPSIHYVQVGSNDGYYEFAVTWPGQGGSGLQREVMTYKVHKLEPATDLGTHLTPTKPKIEVTVYVITPKPGIEGTDNPVSPAPSCTDGYATELAKGSTVTLNRTDGPYSKTINTPTGIAAFADLADGGKFRATLNSGPPPTAVGGFTPCPPTTTPEIRTNQPVTSVSIKLTSQCSNPSTRVLPDKDVYRTEYNQRQQMVNVPYAAYWTHDNYTSGAYTLWNGFTNGYDGSYVTAGSQPPVIVLGGTFYTRNDTNPAPTTQKFNGVTYTKYWYTTWPNAVYHPAGYTPTWNGLWEQDPNDTTGHLVLDHREPVYKNIWQCSHVPA